MEKEIRALEHLHRCVRQSLELLKTEELIPCGIGETLEGVSNTLKKVRSLARDTRKRRLGIFGAPKRGKSTLLNVLLGGDVLPNGTTPTTRCAIEIHNLAGSSERQRIIVHEESGYDTFQHDVRGMDEIRDTLWRCFSQNSTARKIEVYGDFSNGIILENCILVDTPGAETAFMEDKHKAEMGERGESLHLETKRALEMLKEVDVVLFCMRADQIGNKSEVDFYRQSMNRLKPLNIVNFKDYLAPEEEKEVLDEVVHYYDAARRETVMVSARDGLNALLNNAHVTEADKSTLLGPSGMNKLHDAIVERLKSMTPLEAFQRAFWEYEHVLSRHKELLPPRAYIETLIKTSNALSLNQSFGQSLRCFSYRK